MTKRSCHQTAPSNSDIQVEFHPMAWRTAMVASKPRRGSFCSASRLGRFWRFLAAFQGNGGVPWCWSRSLWRGTPTRCSWSNWRKRWETDIKNWYKMNQISWWLCLCLMCLSTFHPSDRLGSVWFRKGLFIFNSLGLEGWKAAGKKGQRFGSMTRCDGLSLVFLAKFGAQNLFSNSRHLAENSNSSGCLCWVCCSTRPVRSEHDNCGMISACFCMLPLCAEREQRSISIQVIPVETLSFCSRFSFPSCAGGTASQQRVVLNLIGYII